MTKTASKMPTAEDEFNTEGIIRAEDPRTPDVKMTVTLPRSVAAFLRWKAEVEGLKRDELLRRLITHYARQLRDNDMQTPEVWD